MKLVGTVIALSDACSRSYATHSFSLCWWGLLGHAIAAVCSRVRVEASGSFVTILYPGAYVELNSGQLETAAPLAQLRIYCAGVWHNAWIALVSFVMLLMMGGKVLIDRHYQGC